MRTVIHKDIPHLIDLYQNTIRQVNCRDYAPAQIEAWVRRGADKTKWEHRIREQYFIAAQDLELLTGFGSLTPEGYLDMLFVHHAHQGKGLARAILNQLEDHARTLALTQVTTDASITAKPFFEKHGFNLVQEQTVFIDEIALSNFKLIKLL